MLAGCDAGRPPHGASALGSPASPIEGAWQATRYESLSLPLHHEVGMLAFWVVGMRFEGRGDVVTVHLDESKRIEGRLSPEADGTRLTVQDRSMRLLDGMITRTPEGLRLRTEDALISLAADAARPLPHLCVDASEHALTRRERCEPGEREQRGP